MLEPINDYVETLRRTHGRDIPIIDPTFGGAEAPLLLVLRQPGPKGAAKTGSSPLTTLIGPLGSSLEAERGGANGSSRCGLEHHPVGSDRTPQVSF